MGKGQIYILTALILTVIIYGMVTVANKTSQESIKGNFEKLSSNYANEGARLINSVIKNSGDVVSTFRNFTRSFTSYSKTQSTDFGLIYALYYTGLSHDAGYLYIGNYLKMPMLVSYNGDDYTFIDGCYKQIPAGAGYDGISLKVDPDSLEVAKCEARLPKEDEHPIAISKVYITIGGYGYTFDVKPDRPEIVLVSRQDTPEQRQVFVDESFISTTDNATLFSDYCEAGDGQACENGKVKCSVAYITKDDCERDTACLWDNENNLCKNA